VVTQELPATRKATAPPPKKGFAFGFMFGK
jgi:hypothetical protein